MEDSFEDVYRQVRWELCVEAASKAITDLEIVVYDNICEESQTEFAKNLDMAADQLMATRNGAVRILGTWRAGGKRGELNVVYVKQFAPTATKVYIVRFLDELIQLQVAKDLLRLGDPTIESLEQD